MPDGPMPVKPGSAQASVRSFLTSSGYYATAKSTAKFAFTSAPMRVLSDVAGAPQNSIIGGARCG